MPTTFQVIQLVLQALSSFGIAGGLIFTAIQFRQYRRTQHFANFSKLVELQMHLREMRVGDPTLAQVYKHDVEHARSERDVREYFFNLMQLSVFEIVWFGYRQGEVPEDYFRGWEKRVRQIAVEPSFITMMNTPSMKIMHDGFQEYMGTLMSEGGTHAERAKESKG